MQLIAPFAHQVRIEIQLFQNKTVHVYQDIMMMGKKYVKVRTVLLGNIWMKSNKNV